MTLGQGTVVAVKEDRTAEGVIPITGTPTDVRSVDKRRVRRVFGQLAPAEIAAVDEGMGAFPGLRRRTGGGTTNRAQ